MLFFVHLFLDSTGYKVRYIPIFFTFDNNYVVPAAVAFHSLLDKAKDGIFYNMYVLHSDITDENIALLESVVLPFKKATLSFVNVGNFSANLWNEKTFFAGEATNNIKQFTSDTILRCFASRFFPQYDKIIYSDVDVVFMDDISELDEIDISNSYIGAVKNFLMKYWPGELDHLSKEHYDKLKDSYFAGGIWILNLKKIREDSLEDRMIEVINDDTIIKKWNDQDIMNISCNNKVTYISLRYISYPYLPDYLKDKNFISHYTKEELLESIYAPKILHFAAFKPWNAYPRGWTIWMKIFSKLGLPKTKIFKDMPFYYRLAYSIWKRLDKILRRKGIVYDAFDFFS